MNIIREDENEKKKQKQLKIFYIIIISICVIAILLAFIIQIVNENNIVSKEEKNNSEISNLTANEISQNKEKFYEIFENKVNYLEAKYLLLEDKEYQSTMSVTLWQITEPF